MAPSRWILLVVFIFLSSPLAAQELTPERPVPTAYQSKLHFFHSTGTINPVGNKAPGMPEAGDLDKKSPFLASLYSLVLPGMGELYADGFSTGKYFLIADGVLWLTLVAFELHGNALRDDARAYSVAAAGVNPAGKDDQFFVDVGNFINIDDYNQKKLRDRNPARLYDATTGYAWSWTTDADRMTYRDQRVASENMYNNKKFVIAALVVNRVASAINAARSAVSYNNALEQAMKDVEFSASLMGGFSNPHGILLSVKKGL
ncbi:MAG: hypothetical protein WBD30_12145 [Bacteroidota bacterium]